MHYKCIHQQTYIKCAYITHRGPQPAFNTNINKTELGCPRLSEKKNGREGDCKVLHQWKRALPDLDL